MALSPEYFSVWLEGYSAGISYGVERGRELADSEAARLHRRAFNVVQMMARIPERDAEADRAAKVRRDARWSA
jgi:hypothetical protein